MFRFRDIIAALISEKRGAPFSFLFGSREISGNTAAIAACLNEEHAEVMSNAAPSLSLSLSRSLSLFLRAILL